MTKRSELVAPAASQGPGPLRAELLDALDLALARRAGGLHPGEHTGPGVGSGTELAQLRPYQVGDDVRQLDPAATARTGTPHVRLQVPERLLTTWIVLDVSPSMAFGTEERLKSDVAAGVALSVGRLATRRGGRVGLLACGGAETRMVPPRGGRAASVGLSRIVGDGVVADGQGNPHALADALARIGRMAKLPGLVVVVSDFRGGVDWRRSLTMVGRRHTLLAAEVRDPREEALPSVGRLALVDPETGQRVEVDTSSARLRRAYAEAEARGREEVAAAMRKARARHVVLSTTGPWLKELGRALR